MRPREVQLDSILDAAELEFADHGIERASMRRIAKRIGVTVGTIYYHCDSKLELVFEVYERAIGRVARMMEECIQSEPTTEKTVSRFMETLFGSFAANPSVPIFLMRCSFGEVRNARRRQSLAPLRAVLERELSRRAEQGQISGVDPQTFFAAATGVVLYLVRRLHRDDLLSDEHAVRAAHEEAARFILGALRLPHGVSQATPSYP
jgi:AcrR family transcriptional regulator